MLFRKSLLLLLLSSVALSAEIPTKIERRIVHDLHHKKYDALGLVLRDKVKHDSQALDTLEELAKSHHSDRMLRAVEATKKYSDYRKGLGFSTGAFLQAAIFCEYKLSHKKGYLPKKKTGLKCPLEYDRKRKAAFMVLDGRREAYLGEGARKTAYKSVYYNNGAPKVVARAEQRGGMKKEAKLMKRLEGASGVLPLYGFGKHKKHGKKYTTVYTKLYNAGDLKTAFEKDSKFSLYEKIRIARGALKGLNALHKRKIIHRDIAAQNIFLNIPKGKKGTRKIEAVIADFGWSNFKKACKHKKAQASLVHTSPEGVKFKHLKGKDYYATDVYALGLVFYRLIYETKGPWKGIGTNSEKKFAKKLRKRLKHEIEERKESLNKSHSTESRAFKKLVLQMISPNPKKRGSAQSLLREMDKIADAVEAH